MTGCCAVNCKNRTETKFRTFKFPADPIRCAKWIQNMRRDKFILSKGMRLCEVHFESSQFEQARVDGWKKLKPNAIPTLFDVPNPPPRIGPVPRRSLYKVIFHFQTRLYDDDRTVIDDSRKMGKPMELVLGKKFKLEVWETIVQAMAINEVAQFTVDKSLVVSYPFVSKTLRDAGKPNAHRMHCCGTALQAEGIGYEDLNKMIKEPRDLEFIIELLKVENSGEYKEESWQMTEEQKLKSVPHLRQDGNNLYRKHQYGEAADKYAQAIGYLEQLMLKEKPRDVEWTELNNMKIPLLLNYAQCKLQTQEYYAVIEHCSAVLESDPDNIKALFRRGKAHAEVWNLDEAKADLGRALQLDSSLLATVNKLLTHLSQKLKEQDDLQRKKLQGKIFS